MKEKTLSEKIDKTFSIWTGGYVPSKAKKFNKAIKEDVKKAVKRLKEEFEIWEIDKDVINELLEKIFGEFK